MSESGARFWGRYGAAGLLLRAPRPDGSPAVLLQHRAAWSEQAAVREAHEETGLAVELVVVRTAVVTAEVAGVGGTHWSYTTVIADAPEMLETEPNLESAELRWVAEDEVGALPLHPGFAASWDGLRELIATIPLLTNDPR